MPEETERQLRITFVSDVSNLDRELDRIERRASRIFAGGDRGSPTGGGVRPGATASDRSDWRSAFAEVRAAGSGGVGDRMARAREREARAAERMAEAAERQSREAESAAGRGGASAGGGSRGGGYMGMLLRRVAVGASIMGAREIAAGFANRWNMEDAAQFQLPGEQVAAQLQQDTSLNTGVASLIYRANQWAANSGLGGPQAKWFYNNFNPIPAIQGLRLSQQRDQAQAAGLTAAERVNAGDLANDVLAASASGDSIGAQRAQVDAERSRSRFNAFQEWSTLTAAHSPRAQQVYMQLLAQADQRAGLQYDIIQRKLDSSLGSNAIAGTVAGLRGRQRDDAGLIGMELANQQEEDLEGNPQLRSSIAGRNRAQEAAALADLNRQRATRQLGYTAMTAVAASQRARDPFAAQQAQLEAQRSRMELEAPEGEKVAAWNAGNAMVQASFWDHYRDVQSTQRSAEARNAQLSALLKGNALEASLAQIRDRRREALEQIPQGSGIFGGMFDYVRQQVGAGFDTEEQLARKKDADERWQQMQSLKDTVAVTGLEAKRQDISARAADIELRAERTSESLRRAGNPDAAMNRRAALQIGLNEEQILMNSLVGHPSSFQGFAMGGIGAGGTSGTQRESTVAGLKAVQDEIKQLRQALLGIQ